MTAGPYTAQEVSGSSLRLDGGAMFGVVPRTLWERKTSPDKRNRIHLAAHPLLLRRTDGSGEPRTVLIEGGTSFTFNEKEKDIYGIAGQGLTADLGRLGVEPGEVDLIVMSHLHFDHAGGLVEAGEDGEIRPAFPRATIVVQKGELEDALDPDPIRQASYRTDEITKLAEAGRFSPVDGEAEVAESIFVEPAPGHTRSHQVIRIGEGNGALVFVGDLIPTSAHINPAWLMSYDLFPLDCSMSRRILLERAVSEEWILYFYHDPRVRAGKVTLGKNGRYQFHPI